MEYFDIAETWDREKIEETQLARLRATVERAALSPFYAHRFREAGSSAESLTCLDDLRRIPFTT